MMLPSPPAPWRSRACRRVEVGDRLSCVGRRHRADRRYAVRGRPRPAVAVRPYRSRLPGEIARVAVVDQRVGLRSAIATMLALAAIATVRAAMGMNFSQRNEGDAVTAVAGRASVLRRRKISL